MFLAGLHASLIKSLFGALFKKAQGRMSLVSASGLVGGVKEYMYRGIQQLPIVLAATSLLFTITTGSVAHANLAGGLIVLIPIYTFLLQTVFGLVLNRFAPGNISWTRSTGDACNIIQTSEKRMNSYFETKTAVESVPSYWLMSVGYFIGYAISNAVDSLLTPAESNADPIHLEKRNSQAVYVIVATCLLAVLLLGMRFSMMRGCEGRGWTGIALSIVSAFGAAAIGNSVYTLSRKCGSRASDLFGILSQILPASSTSPHPIVCSAE